MPRKVFISILGTGFYEECAYTKEKEEEHKPFKSSPTRFIQQASLELVGANDWSKEDRVIIFLTKKARALNWNKTITERTPYGKNTPVPYKCLETVLQEMGLKATIEDKDIRDGMNKEEIWEVFQTIYDTLEEGDEVYMDLTHSFRFLPMLLLVLGNYAKFLKGITIKNIVYGNYEARNAQDEAPIISLLPLASLQDWTFAAANYLQNGRATQLQALVNKELSPILKKAMGADKDASALNQYFNALAELSGFVLNCRGKDVRVGKKINTIHNAEKRIEKIIIPPMVPIFNKIHQPLLAFSPTDNILNGFYAAQWSLNKQLHQQAITLLQETVVSLLCKENGLDLLDKNQRILINKAFAIASDKIPESKWTLSEDGEAGSEKQKEIIKRLIQQPTIIELANTFKEITNIRNDFNHAGEDRGGARTVKSITSGIEKYLNITLDYLGISNSAVTSPTHPHPQSALFINLSNHSSSTWQPAQLAAAKQYGEIIDIDFPAVDALCMPERVDQLANQYALDIINRGAPTCITAHVMGEMTLTFHIVELLKAQGIRCVASTTERIVTDLSDNRKETQFSFVQFREY
jgi:CRISPR-associated protein, TM1812 family